MLQLIVTEETVPTNFQTFFVGGCDIFTFENQGSRIKWEKNTLIWNSVLYSKPCEIYSEQKFWNC